MLHERKKLGVRDLLSVALVRAVLLQEGDLHGQMLQNHIVIAGAEAKLCFPGRFDSACKGAFFFFEVYRRLPHKPGAQLGGMADSSQGSGGGECVSSQALVWPLSLVVVLSGH